MSQQPSQPSANASSSSERKQQQPPQPSNRVYCRWEVSDESLKSLFAQFGLVTEARVVRGPRLRSFGFVTFDSQEAAAQAIAAMNGKGMVSPLTLEYAAPERPRRERVRREVDPDAPQPTYQSSSAAPQRRPRAQPNATTSAPGQPQQQQQPQPSQPRQQQQSQPRRQTTVPAETEDADQGARAPRPRRRRARRVAPETKDPNYGKVVALIPDPIRTPIPPNTQITEVVAGHREYRPNVSNGKIISSLILNADPTKGPFNCDFRLGEFDLKLLSVKVNAKPEGDVRVVARIMHMATNRSREVSMRLYSAPAGTAPPASKHKFFELVKPVAPEVAAAAPPAELSEVFFVGVDSVQLDLNTGLWKKIVLSLVSAVVPKRPPRVPRVPRAQPQTQQAVQGAPQAAVAPQTQAPISNNSISAQRPL